MRVEPEVGTGVNAAATRGGFALVELGLPAAVGQRLALGGAWRRLAATWRRLAATWRRLAAVAMAATARVATASSHGAYPVLRLGGCMHCELPRSARSRSVCVSPPCPWSKPCCILTHGTRFEFRRPRRRPRRRLRRRYHFHLHLHHRDRRRRHHFQHHLHRRPTSIHASIAAISITATPIDAVAAATFTAVTFTARHHRHLHRGRAVRLRRRCRRPDLPCRVA